MSDLFIFLFMIFCHILDDYRLQGCLASLKQKQYWKDNAPDKLYEKDYFVALIMHSLSWSFMISIPIAIQQSFNLPDWFIIIYFVNALIHAVVDDMKANRHKINLIIDQSIHICQIFITFILCKLLMF